MKKFDVIILGDNSHARAIATRLVQSGRTLAMIAPPEPDIVELELLIPLLKKDAATEEASVFPAGIEVIASTCSFHDNHTLQTNNGLLHAKNFIIATGAQAYIPPVQGLNEIQLRSNLDFFKIEKKPSSLIIVGAGPVGVSMASRAADSHCDVTLMSHSAAVLPDEEPEISAMVAERLSQKKVRVLNGAKLLQVKRGGAGIVAVFEQEGKREETESVEIYFATGLIPHLEGLNLHIPGVFINKEKAVAINEEAKTSCPWIYAAGPVTGRKTSLSLSAFQARLAAHNLVSPFFSKMRMENDPLPFTIPFDPPVARLGLTEKQARAINRNVRVTVSVRDKVLIKLVGQKKGARLLGAHIFSPHSEEAILFFDLVLRAEIPLTDLLDEQHYPPLTLGETIHQSIKSWAQNS